MSIMQLTLFYRDAVMVGQAVKVIKTIKKLDLSNNDIDKVRDDSFMDIISLEELKLSGNKLALLQRDAFHRLPRLRKVDLSNNEIRTFHSEAFSDTPLVEELSLNGNQITRYKFKYYSIERSIIVGFWKY